MLFMNYVYGILIILIGIFFTISAFLKSDFVVYRLLTRKSRLLWKDNVHNFYKVVGVILVIFGFLVMFKVI
jgi:hypothetical protein